MGGGLRVRVRVRFRVRVRVRARELGLRLLMAQGYAYDLGKESKQRPHFYFWIFDMGLTSRASTQLPVTTFSRTFLPVFFLELIALF